MAHWAMFTIMNLSIAAIICHFFQRIKAIVGSLEQCMTGFQFQAYRMAITQCYFLGQLWKSMLKIQFLQPRDFTGVAAPPLETRMIRAKVGNCGWIQHFGDIQAPSQPGWRKTSVEEFATKVIKYTTSPKTQKLNIIFPTWRARSS